MKKLFVTLLSLLCMSTIVFGQAKKPTIMVVPSDIWCNEHGYMVNIENQGISTQTPDFKAALQNDMDLNLAIAKINELMSERGFPLRDLQAVLKSIEKSQAEDLVMTSSTSGASIAESPMDKLRNTAKADIIMELGYKINKTGLGKKSIEFILRGIDAYTDKQIAGASGNGAPSASAEVPVLIEEAILEKIDGFNNQLQDHFNDLFENGREVSVEIRVWDSSDTNLESEFNGEELSDIIEAWMSENTVSHRFSTDEVSETKMDFSQVRIPLYRPNGTTAMDTRSFVRQLEKHLKGAPYNLTCKTVQKGLGKARLIIGEK